MSNGERKRKYAAHFGLFTLVGMVLLLGAWMWLKAFPLGSQAQRFNVRFHYVNGLNTNAAVFVNGVRVGAVERISLEGPKHVLVGVKVNQQAVVVPRNAKFSIHTRGLVGADYIDIELPSAGDQQAPLTANSIVDGTDPMRSEIITEELAEKLRNVDLDSVNANLARLALAADNLSVLSHKLGPAAERATIVEDRIAALAGDLRGTTGRVNHLLRDRRFGGDLKMVAQQAREASEHIDGAMERLQTVVADKEARQDLVQIASQLHGSAESIESTVGRIQVMTGDTALRGDAKQILSDARQTMDKVDKLVGQPTFGAEVKATIREAKLAFERMETVGAQLNQILDKRAPLLQMMVGRPGHLQRSCIAGEQLKVE